MPYRQTSLIHQTQDNTTASRLNHSSVWMTEGSVLYSERQDHLNQVNSLNYTNSHIPQGALEEEHEFSRNNTGLESHESSTLNDQQEKRIRQD